MYITVFSYSNSNWSTDHWSLVWIKKLINSIEIPKNFKSKSDKIRCNFIVVRVKIHDETRMTHLDGDDFSIGRKFPLVYFWENLWRKLCEIENAHEVGHWGNVAWCVVWMRDVNAWWCTHRYVLAEVWAKTKWKRSRPPASNLYRAAPKLPSHTSTARHCIVKRLSTRWSGRKFQVIRSWRVFQFRFEDLKYLNFQLKIICFDFFSIVSLYDMIICSLKD